MDPLYTSGVGTFRPLLVSSFYIVHKYEFYESSGHPIETNYEGLSCFSNSFYKLHCYVYSYIPCKNTFGVKKVWPSKVESYLEVNT